MRLRWVNPRGLGPAGRGILIGTIVVVVCGIALAVVALRGSEEAGSLSPPALTNPTTIAVSDSNSKLTLEADKDYVIEMPPTPVTASGGVSIVGGRNVVVVGGEIFDDTPISSSQPASDAYGLYLQDQTGTVHLEGLWIHGRGVGQALVMDQGAGAVVQLQNSRLETLHPVGSVHTDGIQTWRGPHRLQLSNVTIRTAGVGLQTSPHQFEPVDLGEWAYRHVNIEQTTDDAYALWKADHSGGWWPEIHEDFWVKNLGNLAYPDESDWNPGGSALVGGEAFHIGAPPGGDFAPVGSVGTEYAPPS